MKYFFKFSKNNSGHRTIYRKILRYYKPEYNELKKKSDLFLSKIIFLDFDDEKIKNILILILRYFLFSKSIIFLLQPIYFRFFSKKFIINIFNKFQNIKVVDVSNVSLISDPILLYYNINKFRQKKKKTINKLIFHLEDTYQKRLDPRIFFSKNLIILKSNTNFKDSELLKLVNKSQYVWCINKKRFQKQSSGIFWLAIILEKIPIVKRKSYQELICKRFNFPYKLFIKEGDQFKLKKMKGNWLRLNFVLNECEFLIKNL